MSIAEQNGTQTTALVPVPPTKLVVHDEGPAAYLFDTARFEHMQRIAKVMALASLAPDHLTHGRDKKPLPIENAVGNCMLVVNQSVRWGMDPFAVAPETYVVGNKLGFQGKLVAAVVNARSGLQGRLRCEYTGNGENRTVTVIGTFKDELDARTITLSVAQAKTSNDMWRKDPDQKLWYSGVTKWARRHCPEIMLGVLTEDDLERLQQVQSRPSNSQMIEHRLANVDATSPAPAPEATIEPPELTQEVAIEIHQEPANEPPTDQVQSSDLDHYRELMATIDTQKKCDDLCASFKKSNPEDMHQDAEEIRDARKKEIHENRGAGSNKQQTMV